MHALHFYNVPILAGLDHIMGCSEIKQFGVSKNKGENCHTFLYILLFLSFSVTFLGLETIQRISRFSLKHMN